MTKLFIIHGWSYSLDKWTNFVEELKRQGFEPVQLKVPGLTEPSDKVWSINDYINWLDEQLKGAKTPVVIGHSNGGRIALSYAQRYPGRLGKLVLIDSAGIARDQRRSTLKLQLLRYLSKIGKPLAYLPPAKKIFYKFIGAQDYLNAPPNMKLTMRNMLDADSLIDLASIRLPVAIIWGRDDTITPLADGQKLHAGITGSSFHIVDGARHAPFFTEPKQVAELVAAAVKESGKSIA